MEATLQLTTIVSIRHCFVFIVLFGIISFAYLDKYMNYSGVYRKKSLDTYWSAGINVNVNVNNNVVFHGKAQKNTGISVPSPANTIFKTLRYGKAEIALLINTPVCVQRVGKDRRIMVHGAHKEKLTQLHFYQVRILLSGVCY